MYSILQATWSCVVSERLVILLPRDVDRLSIILLNVWSSISTSHNTSHLELNCFRRKIQRWISFWKHM